MNLLVILLPLRLPCGKSSGILYFVQQNVTALCLLRHNFQRSGITADDNDLVRRREFKSIAFQGSVADRECLYRDAVILINDS